MSHTENPNSRNFPSLLIHAAAAVLLAIFVCALFYRLLLTNQVLASGDILYYFYPYRDYAMQALREGRVPLWNPYSFLGVPFLANPQAAVLYPLHWPLSWMSVTKHIYWSAALHAWLLGLGGYALMRQWRFGFWAGCTTAFVLAGSGFYGGMIGHINQMNGAAWLPWALLILVRVPVDPPPQTRAWWRQIIRRRSLPALSLFGVCVALMLLAGHTQTTYINLFGIGAWVVIAATLNRQFVGLFRQLFVYASGCLLGVLISAAQLLPTIELSGLGLRSGGLSYGEASSFSLDPSLLFWTLLPNYGLRDLGVIFETLGYSEFVAYVGAIGLLLALIGALRGNRQARLCAAIFIVLGFALALGRWNPLYLLLYKFVPGFDLFRTPARWMMLYTMGMAILAGAGISALGKRRGMGLLAGLILLFVGVDLTLAARSLPHTDTTAPQAVYDVRTAPAFLQSDPQRSLHPAAAGRFLSMSTTTFDPGDMADYRRILLESDPPQIDERAFMQLLVAQKAQEILAPNLPLFWRVPAVDGFDGGVLPLQRYIKALELFVPPDRLVPDGRLREQVREIPSANLLSLLNVRYIITDKVHDFWFENIYYDRKIGATLTPDTVSSLTIEPPLPFEATHLMLIGAVVETDEKHSEENTADPAEAITAAAAVRVNSALDPLEFIIHAGSGAGAQLADQALDSPMAAQSGATVAYRNVDGGTQEYLVPLKFDAPLTPKQIQIDLLDSQSLLIRAATLFDERTKMFQPLTVSDRGRFDVVHGGDVKMYENLDVLPRAYLIHNVINAQTDEAAFERVQSGEIDFSQTAVVTNLAPFTTQPSVDDSVEIISYAAESLTIQVTTVEDAFLVISDTFYPGWRATVDEQETVLFNTNYLFRGLKVPAGEHVIRLRYQPTNWRVGVWLSALGILATIALGALGHKASKRERKPIIDKELI